MACSKVPAEFSAANSKFAETIRTIFNDERRQNEECEVEEVYTRLEKISEFVNDSTSSESTIHTTWIRGLCNAPKRHQRERSSHFLDVNDCETGPVFKILRLEANFECVGDAENCRSILHEQEIYDRKEMTASVVLAPNSKLIRWQLVSHILGQDIGYDHIIDTSDTNSYKFALDRPKCVAKILVPRQIFYDYTQFRIKHKVQDKFLTVVTHKGCPCATLGLNSQFYFVLHKTPEGIRIKAVNTTVPYYVVLYSSESGAIHFDKLTTALKKTQCWTISKADPLCNGDTVSFMNKMWDDSALCFSDGSVSCLRNTEDEWVLMI